jgi:predicted nucleotidyltransferase
MNRHARDTGDPAATEMQIGSLVEGARDVLRGDLVGAYLHGSAVLGGFRPDSDIDVIVVSARRTTADEKRRLVDLLLSLSGRKASLRPGRPIELDVVVESEIRPWRYPPTFDFKYNELLRDRFESGELEPWADTRDRDLASAVTMALLGDEPLAGRQPAQVFDPVPRRDYIDAILRDVGTVDQYLSWDTRNVVLTLPRIWSAVATGAVYSKEDAAGWALPRLPEEHRAVLERARAAYRGEAEDSWGDATPQVRAFADHVLSEIERARTETNRTTSGATRVPRAQGNRSLDR